MSFERSLDLVIQPSQAYWRQWSIFYLPNMWRTINLHSQPPLILTDYYTPSPSAQPPWAQ